MKLNISKSCETVLKKLNENGFDAYAVGGCVRDLVLGNTPFDYDITTSATPKDIKKIFDKTIDTGIQHGTVTVIEDNTAFEITTFRTESDYSDMRRPDEVQFVSDITLDLSRRDFTVNAACYNPKTGIIDCFGSVQDIEEKILKAVGNAEQRFNEDALRILRLFRFSSTLDFSIEPQTFKAAIKFSPLLQNISVERIMAEFKKALLGKKTEYLNPLLECGALRFCGIDTGNLAVLNRLEQRFEVRFYTFLKLTAKDIAYSLDQLKCSNQIKKYCNDMEYIGTHLKEISAETIKEILNYTDSSTLRDFALYKNAVFGADASEILDLLESIICKKEPYKISHLAITGEDLMQFGISGKELGETLEFLRREVVKNKSLNQKLKLIEIVKNKRN